MEEGIAVKHNWNLEHLFQYIIPWFQTKLKAYVFGCIFKKGK